eukprot:gene25682-20019_t
MSDSLGQYVPFSIDARAHHFSAGKSTLLETLLKGKREMEKKKKTVDAALKDAVERGKAAQSSMEVAEGKVSYFKAQLKIATASLAKHQEEVEQAESRRMYIERGVRDEVGNATSALRDATTTAQNVPGTVSDENERLLEEAFKEARISLKRCESITLDELSQPAGKQAKGNTAAKTAAWLKPAGGSGGGGGAAKEDPQSSGKRKQRDADGDDAVAGASGGGGGGGGGGGSAGVASTTLAAPVTGKRQKSTMHDTNYPLPAGLPGMVIVLTKPDPEHVDAKQQNPIKIERGGGRLHTDDAIAAHLKAEPLEYGPQVPKERLVTGKASIYANGLQENYAACAIAKARETRVEWKKGMDFTLDHPTGIAPANEVLKWAKRAFSKRLDPAGHAKMV